MVCKNCGVQIGDGEAVVEIRRAVVKEDHFSTDRMFATHSQWVHYECVRNGIH